MGALERVSDMFPKKAGAPKESQRINRGLGSTVKSPLGGITKKQTSQTNALKNSVGR